MLFFSRRRMLVLLAAVLASRVGDPRPPVARGADAVAPASAPVAWQIPRRDNRWAHFERAAWKTIRTKTETFGESGQVAHTSVATTTITLSSVTKTGYRLRTTTTLHVDGKRMSAPPQTVQYDLFDQAGAPATIVRDGGATTVMIDGQAIPCRIYHLETNAKTGPQRTTLHYAADVPPYVLRRSSQWTDTEGKVTVDELTAEVVHLHLRRRVLDTPLWTTEENTIRRSRKGMTVTVSYSCREIPGGIVSRMSTEFDAAGNVIRCTELELIGYGCQSAPIRLLPQVRPHRRFRRRR